MTKREMFVEAHKRAKKYDGNYRACFALALKELHKEAKGMKFEWVTAKGAKIELTVTEKTVVEEIYADGWKGYTKTEKIKEINYIMNGIKYNDAKFGYINARNCIRFKIGKRDAATYIPRNIYNQIFAKEIAVRKRMEEEEEEFENYRRTMYKAMSL